jgi:NodT family efflux transporter outer membrane factor (OMF) lipoprotein
MIVTMKPVRALCKISVAVAVCAFAGCLVGPRYEQPEATAEAPPPAYKEGMVKLKDAPGWKVAKPSDEMLRGKWWSIFRDSELNALEDQLTVNNQNVKLFYENYLAARAIVGQNRSQLFPTIAGGASFSRSFTAGATVPLNNIAAGPLTFNYQPDLWGKVRNAVREAKYNAQASNALLENERLALQASMAIFYFEMRGQDALIQLLAETIAADKKSLDFTRAQFETGVGTKISVVEAENVLQNAQATATSLGILRAQFEHAIAVLAGKNPTAFSILSLPLKATAPPIPVGLPSQLLERRPDIAAAERTMAAANAQIGIATAAYFPTVELGASGGFSTRQFSTLFSNKNREWSIGPSVSETIFDAGLRRATVQQFIATYNADVASYRQTVLTAFQQVEDSLAQVRIASKQLTEQRQAEASAKEFLKLELDRFQTGIDPYVNVVTAQTTLLSDQVAAIQVQVQEMTAAVQLIEALGGGWDRSQLPSPGDVAKPLTHAETAIMR